MTNILDDSAFDDDEDAAFNDEPIKDLLHRRFPHIQAEAEAATFEPEPAQMLPAPNVPQEVARLLAGKRKARLRFWMERFYEHTGTHYRLCQDGEVNTWIRLETERATYEVHPANDKPVEIKKWSPNKNRVSEVVEALKYAVVPHYGDVEGCMAVPSGVLDPVTRTLKDHTPDRFNMSCLPFDYDPAAKCPTWLEFLDHPTKGVLPGDKQAQDFLGEWFGYVLSGRKDIHKMATLVGARRSGKGTIAGILQDMVGADGYATPILGQLAGDFGLHALMDKSLAVLSDVKWDHGDTMAATPILLGLGADDPMDINRKGKDVLTGVHLPTRVMMLSNDAPDFRDASGALTGRLVLVEFQRSFYGHEDTTLKDRLRQELPGILNWALDGLDRLTERGRFTEPESSAELRHEVEQTANPIGAWVDEWCVLEEGHEETVDDLLTSHLDWCDKKKKNNKPDLAVFSRKLRATLAGKGPRAYRPRGTDGKQVTKYKGLRIVGPDDAPF